MAVDQNRNVLKKIGYYRNNRLGQRYCEYSNTVATVTSKNIRCPRDASRSRAAALEQSRRPTDVKLIALGVLKEKGFEDNGR